MYTKHVVINSAPKLRSRDASNTTPKSTKTLPVAKKNAKRATELNLSTETAVVPVMESKMSPGSIGAGPGVQQNLLSVTVPVGARSGQRISVPGADGDLIHVKVPLNMKPGMQFTVDLHADQQRHVDL